MTPPLLLLIWTLMAPIQSGMAAITADEIVAKADEVRNPQIDYKAMIKVTSYKPRSSPRSADYEVLFKGRDRTLVKTLAPTVERGVSILMVGRDLWTFLPDVSQPVRISMQQRLLGEISVGDIARANFSGDYKARLVKEDAKSYFLELSALGDYVAYDRVAYTVRKADFRPIRADFFGASGKRLKTCRYEDFKILGDRQRPSRLVMTDAAVADQKSVVHYSEVTLERFPDKFFTKDFLKKLKY
ncbi:MAG: outer membrane lipoprotein-sorting protein [Elusimicrobia bacterium]|nr:outer membrane lipoprotein-sorting protein [Elusimicrobiota bacterium]